jgi:sugar phosphate isomerase/epimerase
VCSWSIDREDAVAAIRVAGCELDLRLVQLGFFSRRAVDSADADQILAAARESDVRIVGTFAGFEHEDYASIAAIARTGGLTPDHLYRDRLEMIERVGQLSASLGCRFVAIHVGTVPDDPSAPDWAALATRTAQVADRLASRGLQLLLETGREPVSVLLGFIDAVGRSNISVNFDPGNLVVYSTDDPAKAVSALRGRIAVVHLKDAHQSVNPGTEYGRRAALGAGDAQIARVVSRLRAIAYEGPLLIESGGPEGGLEAIREATAYLRSMLE